MKSKKERLKKGQYGYRNAHLIRLGLITGGLLLLIALQIWLASRCAHSLKLLFTFTGIITVLPMANTASPFLAMCRFRTPDRSRFETVRKYADRGMLLCDLVFTTKEHIFPVDFLLLRPQEVHCLYSGTAGQKAELKDHLQRYLRLEKVYAEIFLHDTEEAFCGALEGLTADASDGTEEKKAEALLKSISF